MDRLEIVRYFLTREQRGLEIGASFNPIAPKADGWNVETIDHASKDALVEKFLPHAVDVSKIEDVDWIWRGEPLDELIDVARLGTYDYCIASHVVEHIPDLLGFFKSMERLLRPRGTLSLVIPDKRHCFDYFKALTSTSDVLCAHERRLRRHTKRTAFEQIAYATARDGSITWDERQVGELSLIRTLGEAMYHFRTCDESETAAYRDYHCSFFVPSSFELLIEELAALQLTRLRIVKQFSGSGCEFYVTLRNEDDDFVEPQAGYGSNERRLQLLKQIGREMASVTTGS